MRPFWKKKEETSTAPTKGAVDTDLLAQEEDAFVASVLKKRQEREAQGEVRKPEAVSEPEAFEWTEQEDVYRPKSVRAPEFLASLALKQTPDLKPGALCCFVRRSAFDRIQAHLRSNTKVELGGLLMGEAFYDSDLNFYGVIVEEALPAYEGEGTAQTFSYTEATWKALSPQLQMLPPAWTLIGSFHSHPGLGVFLSSTDLETQHDVFFHDWQIALVIDPISHAIGFFFGAEGHRCTYWEVI